MIKSLQALKEEDHRRALYAVLVFIMLMILFFLLVSLEEPDPPLEEIIMEVQMPDVEIEMGSQPKGGGQESTTEETVVSSEQVDSSDPDATQEESPVTVTDSNGSEDNDNTETDNTHVDEGLSFPGSGHGQGDGNGDDFGSGSGVGGHGQGNVPGDGTYNPSRKVVQKPSFDSNVQEEGKIALDIWVDSEGKVIKTRFKESKSTSGSAYLMQLAEKAARTMRYDKRPGAGTEHVGYFVFGFIKS